MIGYSPSMNTDGKDKLSKDIFIIQVINSLLSLKYAIEIKRKLKKFQLLYLKTYIQKEKKKFEN